LSRLPFDEHFFLRRQELLEMNPMAIELRKTGISVGDDEVGIERLTEKVKQRVIERTNELRVANDELRKEVNERKQAEEKLKATSEQMRALSARVQATREEEGARIAREIHDELGSALTSLKWGLDEIDSILSTTATKSDANTLRRKIAALTKMVEGTLNTVRRISSELRPSILDDKGLVATLEWEAQKFEARTGITCHVDALTRDVHLTLEQSTAVFRIFQEALTNVIRHAYASTVNITVKEQKGEFVLQVEDNGKGLKDAEISGTESLGLLGMRERAHLIGGDVSITSAEGGGTVVAVHVPIAVRELVRKMTR
jgi:signal transduction histidine kinase